MQNNRLAPRDVPKLIEELQAESAYGELSIRFRQGRIVSYAVTRTFAAEDSAATGGTPRDERDTQH
jgi:hypothetical protein